MLLALLLATLAGCGKRPDLLALAEGPDMASTCRLDEKGRLVVTIHNQGKRISKATTTQIVFGSLPAIRLPTRPVPPGDSVSVTFPIPEECFQPECQFRITVDANNEVDETDEMNNSAKGLCGGGRDSASPAGS